MRLPLLAGLLLLAACEHSSAPAGGSWGEEGPFQPGDPVQLTYSEGSDRTPQWGNHPADVLYAFDDIRTTGSDRLGCVGAIPALGGTRTFQTCPIVPGSGTGSLTWPAEREDGTLAYHRTWISGFMTLAELVRLPTGEGAAPVRLLPVPFFEPNAGKSMQGVANLQWLGRDSLIFIGQGVVHSLNDNVESGFEIVLLAAAEGTSGVSGLPGTTWASSLALGATTDTVYFTLGGDSLVYRRVRSTGATDTVANFGALGIARGVQVRAGRVVAVVGGDVTWGPHESLGMAQYDEGGPIYFVDLGAGIPTPAGQPYDRYFTPALAPDGSAVIAAQFGDLWRIALP
jgi:hypothetical protein